MAGQKKLSEGRLLNERGALNEAGYATALVKEYDRAHVKANKLRLKEWDYYLITDGKNALALTIADNGYMGLTSWSLLTFDTPWQQTVSKMSFFPMGKTALPKTSVMGDVRASGRGYQMEVLNDGRTRRLSGACESFFEGEALRFELTLSDPPKDSMVIATPFPKKEKAFYYNQKINCIPAEGFVTLGARRIEFHKNTALAVLDWGRGVWTYSNTWYWSSASGYVDGRRFGFNLGYGFGDTSAASENMLFLDGIAHKLSRVTFEIPQKDGHDDFLSPWRFTSDDGRVALSFAPVLDRAALTDFKLLVSDQHQVFGHFSGFVTLDLGEQLPIDHLLGFAEKVRNKW